MSELTQDNFEEAEFRPISPELAQATIADFTDELTFQEKLARLRKAANDDPSCDYVAPKHLRAVTTVAMGKVMTAGYEGCDQDKPRLQ